MNARDYQLFGPITSRVETQEKVIALTFDDGPTDKTGSILSLLEDYEVKATFFLIGWKQDTRLVIIRILINVWY